MPRRTTEFQTIRSEGGLLPPDLLRRVVDPAGKVPGVEPTAYGLPAGERLNEAITQSWNRLRRHWAEFRTAVSPSSLVPSSSDSSRPSSLVPSSSDSSRPSSLVPSSSDSSRPSSLVSPPSSDANTGLTNDKWSLPLLRELGFGFLATSAGPTIDGKTYAISRFAGTTAIHLVGCGVSLDRRAAGVRGAAAGNPHGLVQEFLNRSSGHLWAIVSNGLAIRILRDNQALSRQSFLEFDLEAMFDGEVYSDFVLLWLMAHATRFLPRGRGRDEGRETRDGGKAGDEGPGTSGAETCWLETWSKEAAEQGVAALTDLRGGVEKALEILGQGFVSHPKNTALRDALRKGDVKLSDFHHQLLRVVYRLIFLFVSEDRELDGISILHPRERGTRDEGRVNARADDAPPSSLVSRPSTLATARERYAAHYSTSRLREVASRIKGSRHGDLWRQFQLLVGALSGEERFAAMREALALPSLGSMLWSPASTALLNGPGLANGEWRMANGDAPSSLDSQPSADKTRPSSLVSSPSSDASRPPSPVPRPSEGAELSNHDFLDALRHLAFIRKDKILRPVDYKNLGSEEFGGVYESFLALTPQISSDGARFTFAEFAGNERKTSGSYYTPDSLVQCLLDSALDPVVRERLADGERMASSEWRMVQGVFRIAFAKYANQRLSRPGGLATRTSPDRETVSTHAQIPGGGEVRADLPAAPGGSVHSVERGGGVGPALHGGIHPGPPPRQWQPDRSGDPTHPERGPGVCDPARGGQPAPGNRDPRQETAQLGTIPSEAHGERRIANGGEASGGSGSHESQTRQTASPPSADHSPFAVPHSPLASPSEAEIDQLWRGTPFATRHSLFAETALLSLKVCDKACGSGHFLVGAGHRLARHLARVRALAQGESEPSPLLYQTALRDVIGHCLYGVDINPMAVELCKVTLWLEALEPGKPLSFLDHHIRCGNSLLGATPELIKGGIPDEAYEAIEGDDKEACAALKKRNKRENPKLGDWFVADEAVLRDKLYQASAAIEEMNDSRPEDIQRKEAAFRNAQQNYDFQKAWDLANLWCAAFVIEKRFPDSSLAGAGEDGQRPGEGRRDAPATLDDQPLATQGGLFGGTEDLPKAKAKKTKAPSRPISEVPFGISTQHLRDFVEGGPLPDGLLAETKRLSDQYQFFHWHLAFPEVFAQGGFDVNLGNPPWETLSPDAKEFFSAYDPEVRNKDKDGQAAIIERLLHSPGIASAWENNRRDIFAVVHFIKDSGRYQLFAEGNLGKGDFNVYRMFVETALTNTRKDGFSAQFVPEGIYNGANCAAIRNALFTKCTLTSLLGCENAREIWFKDIDTRTKFALYTARVSGTTDRFLARFNIRSHEALSEVQRGIGLRVPVSMVREFSPDALAIMEFGDQRDIDIATKMYARWPKFGDESAGPPMRTYMREFDMGGDREVFGNDPDGLPLFEGRMVDLFDYRAKGYRSGRGRSAVWEELPFGKPGKSIQPQWRVPLADIPEKVRGRMNRYRIGFCDVASPTNERSLYAALLPPGAVSGHKVPTILFTDGWDWAFMLWIAVANSFAMDFIARKKVSLSMSYTVLDSLPFPRIGKDDPLARKLVPMALRLTCCGPEMTDYWNAMAAEGWVAPITPGEASPGVENEDERLKLRAELDALVARDIFGLTAIEMEYILATFPTWQEREEKQYGEFRTRRLILEAFDRLPNLSASPIGSIPHNSKR